MKLKSFGCSLIFGNELSDDHGYPSKLTWPALLSKKLELEYECHARPGCGNLQILEQVLNQSIANDPAIFVVGWSWIDRFDYRINTPGIDRWETITSGNNSKLAKTYYRDLSSEFRDKFSTLIYIKTAIDTLKQQNIRFIMTYMDPWLFEQRWHVTPAILDLQKQVLPYMTTFEGKNFLDWSRDHGYPEGVNWHPLDQAHDAAADYMIKFFDKQKTINTAQLN
jgi:hypothetical protein